jgi:type I restriction enzyme S subunit
MSNKLGYKTTEIGIIPNEWEVVRLGDVLKFTKNGLTYRQTKQGKYPVTRIETISEGVIDTNKLGYLDNLSDEEIKGYNLEVGDILFSHINSIEHIAKAAIYLGKPELLIHGMNLLLLRPNNEMVEPMFLLFYLKYEETRNRFRSWAKKAVNQASINQSELNAFLMPLPPIPEQRRIASILSTVDEAIQKTDEIIQKARELKKGLMQRLLAKGIGHTKFKLTEIGEIPEEWEVTRINQICKVRRGASPRPIGDPSYFSDKGRGWVRIIDATSSFKYLRHTTQYLSEKGASKSVKVNPGDLIMSICATIGKPIIVDMKACIHDGFVWFSELSEKVDTEYLFYVLQDYERRFISKRQMGTQGNLNTAIVGKTVIPFPPLPEQQKIAEILSNVDEKIEKEKQRKEQLERLKKGFMQDLLTGRVRVKVD